MSQGLLLSDIDTAENARKSVRVKLAEMGRELYKIRNGEELDLRFTMDGYERCNFSGSEFSGQHGPDWGVGTPIISVIFFWSYQGGCDAVYVTFPQSYLATDWRTTETERVSKERQKSAKIAAKDKAKKAKKRDAAERETYARLRAKYAE